MKKITKLLFTVSVLAITSIEAHSQTFDWAGRYGGDGEDVVVSMHTDNEGNTFSTGYFTNNCDFNIGPDENIISNGVDYEIFVSKTNSDGVFQWAKRMGGISGENGTSITTDNSGNVYVTGVYQESADFDPGNSEFILTATGMLDIFVLKLDADGNFLWAKSFGGIDYESTTGIGVDSLGNIYLSGYFYFTTDFNPGAEEFLMTPIGSGDGFAVKLDPTGNFIWAVQFGGENLELAMAMEVLENGDLYLTGNYSGIVDFNPDPIQVFNLTTPDNYDGIFLLQLNTNGAMVNASKIAECDFHMYGLGLDRDSSGQVYISGYFGGNANFVLADSTISAFSSPTYYNGYIVKVNAGGQPVWAKFLDADLGSQVYDIGVNSLGEVLAYGFYTGTLNASPLIVVQEANDNAQENFLAKFNADGDTATLLRFGGANFVDGCTFGIDQNDNIYLSAAFENTADINPNPLQVEPATSLAYRDNYILKLNNEKLSVIGHTQNQFVVYPNPTTNVINISSKEPLFGESYDMFDITGRKVLSGTILQEQSINLSTLQSGTYMLAIANTARPIIKN